MSGATEISGKPGATADHRLRVESLDLDAQGIAHRDDGKVVFIEGALPFEVVSVVTTRSKPSFEKATVTTVHKESSQRVVPLCPHFGLHEGACGGCKMQHMHQDGQIAVKQRALEDSLWHLGKVKAENILRPIQGPAWGYRYRARLSVRYVRKKNAVLVGFHERKSSFVADMRQCLVLPPGVSAMLLPLRAMFERMDARETCPQIELAVGDMEGGLVIALVLRHLAPLSPGDFETLRSFARDNSTGHDGKRYLVQWWLQAQGPDTIKLLDEGGAELAYTLEDFGVRMPFRPTDFTQVNPHINRVLVGHALRLLDAKSSERVIDWFCGLGNFTLPLATQAGEVLGIEGSRSLVARAQDNARLNQLAATPRPKAQPKFLSRDLFAMSAELLVQDGVAQKWLLDPPREGAFALVKSLAELHQVRQAAASGAESVAAHHESVSDGWSPPTRIVYVSCNPATLARDAELLVHHAGYKCSSAGIVNMFPHTAHVESIAVFDLQT